MLDRSSERRVAEKGMGPFCVVVLDVLAKESPQVALVDHDHVVQHCGWASPGLFVGRYGNTVASETWNPKEHSD